MLVSAIVLDMTGGLSCYFGVPFVRRFFGLGFRGSRCWGMCSRGVG